MQVVKAPDERLRIRTKPVKKFSPKYSGIVKDMAKLTKTFTDPEGVGLASTQIGNNEQYFVAKLDRNGFKAFFNPMILKTGKRQKTYFEGCLSIPNYYGQVRRFTHITVSYQNEKGEKITEKLSGILAWIFQHETDHLNGILFPDRVLEQKGRFFKFNGRDKAGNDLFEEVIL